MSFFFFFHFVIFLFDSTDGLTAIFTWGYSSQRFFLCVWCLVFGVCVCVCVCVCVRERESEREDRNIHNKKDRQTDRQRMCVDLEHLRTILTYSNKIYGNVEKPKA